MDEIIFVTHNKGKIASAQKQLEGVNFKVFEYDLDEPRSDDIKYISKYKVEEAYKIVKKPCISLDSGFWIDALNGFPRAFVNFSLDTIGIDGILQLMKGKKDRNCKFTECLSYYDGNEIHQFMGQHPGKLTTEALGNDTDVKWSDLWYVFIPYGSNKTLAQMNDIERENRPRPNSVNSMSEFAKWYKSQNRK